MRRTMRIAALTGSLALMAAPQALAHAHLVSASPADKAAVGPPHQISLRFNEKLEPKFSGLKMTDARGTALKLRTTVAKDGMTLVGSPARPLAPGAYKVTWHVVASDAHRMQGTLSFTVK